MLTVFIMKALVLDVFIMKISLLDVEDIANILDWMFMAV